MTSFDTSAVINWVISGFIGLVFGIISAWITHRYQKERDSIAWEREKEKLRQQFEHELKMLEVQFQQRLVESEQQAAQKQVSRVRDEILKGVDNPNKSLNELLLARRQMLPSDNMYSSTEHNTKYNYLAQRLKTYLVVGFIGLAIIIGIIITFIMLNR